MFRKTASRPGAIVILLAAFGLAAAAGASAATIDNLVPNNRYAPACLSSTAGDGHPCQTDNSNLTYFADVTDGGALNSSDLGEVRDALGDYQRTDLTITHDSTPTYSGSAETDVIFQKSSTGISSTADGIYWCNGAGSGSYECDQGYVRIRPNHYSRGLVCHEFGHAVGLTHGDNADPRVSKTDSRLGCLVTPVGPNATLGTNNASNLDALY